MRDQGEGEGGCGQREDSAQIEREAGERAEDDQREEDAPDAEQHWIERHDHRCHRSDDERAERECDRAEGLVERELDTARRRGSEVKGKGNRGDADV